jgi:MYXO-CTERM domain-containing protein
MTGNGSQMKAVSVIYATPNEELCTDPQGCTKNDVPLPGSLPLTALGLGLLGMGALHRRRQQGR